MKELLKKYKHGWILSYFFVYVGWFFWLGGKELQFHAVETVFDAHIPFNELFIIPYFLWFAYIPVTVAYFFFTSKNEFYKLCAFLFIGMTIALVSYTIYPTIVTFRPDLDAMGRDNICIDLVKFIYAVDPGTNVCPSIHCYNAIGLAIAITHNKKLKDYKLIQIGSIVLSTLICMSTVLIKQHSLIDVGWAAVMAAGMYLIVYLPSLRKNLNMLKYKKRLNVKY